MYDICCVGHLTLDKVVTPQAVKHMAGGTSFYFSNAIRNMDVSYVLVTSLALSEMPVVEKLRDKGIEINATTGGETVYFENIYSGNQDHRTQRVLQKADPFVIEQLNDIEAKVFHLGPLLADDISTEFIKKLSQHGQLSLDAQGYLRKVEDKNVIPVDWPEKREALQYITTLKVNEHEMEVLTGLTDIHEGAKILNDWGVKEVVVTLGSMGSVIYVDGVYYTIPAYKPTEIVDATGCGDTYMAGYLFQRAKGKGYQEAGEFAAAMASLNIQTSGPFVGTEEDVLELLASDKALKA